MPKTMQLPCHLTDPDRLRISEVLTAEIKSREQVEAAKKAAVKDFNVALKAHRAREHDFNESLFTGTEVREVEVEERPDYTAGIVFIHRLDTGDCVQQRAIDPDERQVKLGMDGPKLGSVDGDRADEQVEASTPDEAERLYEERLANERAERISAAVTEARAWIMSAPVEWADAENTTPVRFEATLQHGEVLLSASGGTEDTARDGVVSRLVEILEAEEDARPAPEPTWEDVAAASKAQQDAAEVERLAAEQASDDAATKKRTLKTGAAAKADGLKNGGLKVPAGARKKGKRITAQLPDGRVVDPEEEVAAQEAVATADTGEPLADLCPPACDVDHRHSQARTDF